MGIVTWVGASAVLLAILGTLLGLLKVAGVVSLSGWWVVACFAPVVLLAAIFVYALLSWVASGMH